MNKKDYLNTKGLNKNEINERYKVYFTFIDDDFIDYTDDENELNERIKVLEKTITDYEQKHLYYTKESILTPHILRVLAHCIKNTDEDLDPQRLNELIENYNNITDFIENDGNHEDIIRLYNGIVEKDGNGFYEINDTIAYKIIDDSNFNVSDKDVIEDIKDAITTTWENKKEILSPSDINKISEQNNGINFKQFIFCEEYLKTGKIKPTCDNLGISRNTAYNWLDDKKVQAYLNKRQDEIKKETDNIYLQTFRESFNQLNNMIKNSYTDTTDKIKAIDTFLKHYENIERLKQPSTTYED